MSINQCYATIHKHFQRYLINTESRVERKPYPWRCLTYKPLDQPKPLIKDVPVMDNEINTCLKNEVKPLVRLHICKSDLRLQWQQDLFSPGRLTWNWTAQAKAVRKECVVSTVPDMAVEKYQVTILNIFSRNHMCLTEVNEYPTTYD